MSTDKSQDEREQERTRVLAVRYQEASDGHESDHVRLRALADLYGSLAGDVRALESKVSAIYSGMEDEESTERGQVEGRRRPSSFEIKNATWEKLTDRLEAFRDGGDPGALTSTLLYIIYDAIASRSTSEEDEEGRDREVVCRQCGAVGNEVNECGGLLGVCDLVMRDRLTPEFRSRTGWREKLAQRLEAVTITTAGVGMTLDEVDAHHADLRQAAHTIRKDGEYITDLCGELDRLRPTRAALEQIRDMARAELQRNKDTCNFSFMLHEVQKIAEHALSISASFPARVPPEVVEGREREEGVLLDALLEAEPRYTDGRSITAPVKCAYCRASLGDKGRAFAIDEHTDDCEWVRLIALARVPESQPEQPTVDPERSDASELAPSGEDALGRTRGEKGEDNTSPRDLRNTTSSEQLETVEDAGSDYTLPDWWCKQCPHYSRCASEDRCLGPALESTGEHTLASKQPDAGAPMMSAAPRTSASSEQPKPEEDEHDRNPVVGQCCNAASRQLYGPCKYCGRLPRVPSSGQPEPETGERIEGFGAHRLSEGAYLLHRIDRYTHPQYRPCTLIIHAPEQPANTAANDPNTDTITVTQADMEAQLADGRAHYTSPARATSTEQMTERERLITRLEYWAGVVEHSYAVKDMLRAAAALRQEGNRGREKYEALIAALRYDLRMSRELHAGTYWFWMGDGTDDLASLTCPVVIAPHELAELLERRGRSPLPANPDEPEPGDFIMAVHCPCCGADISVTAGDDEGEISVVGTPTAAKNPDEHTQKDAVERVARWLSDNWFEIGQTFDPYDNLARRLLTECALTE